jgi:hypothetical protein
LIPLKLLLPTEYADKTELYTKVTKHKLLAEGEYAFAVMYALDSPNRLFFGVFQRGEEKPLALLSIEVNKKNAKASVEESLADDDLVEALLELFQQELPKNLKLLQEFLKVISEALQDPQDPIHQKIARRTAWLATRFPLPTTVDQDGDSFRPEAIAWIDGDSGEILSLETIHPAEGENALITPLKKLLKKHGPPPMIRVEKEGQASAIRAMIKKIPVLVEEIPELGIVQEFITQQFEDENKPAPTYLSADATQGSITTLFQVAAKVFRAAPWKKWADYPMLQLDVPSLKIKSGAITMMGQGKTSFGFMFFTTGEDAQDFYDFANDDEPDEEGPNVPFLVLEFSPAADLDPTLRKEIAAHTWEVSNTKGFPVLKDLDEDMTLQPITEQRVKTAIACCEAILFFYAAHQKQLANEDDFEAQGELKNKDLGNIRFAWPHPEVIYEPQESHSLAGSIMPSAEEFGEMLRKAASGDLDDDLLEDDDDGAEFEIPEELGQALFDTLSKMMQQPAKKPAKKLAAKKTSAKTKPAKKPTAKKPTKTAAKKTSPKAKPTAKKPAAKKPTTKAAAKKASTKPTPKPATKKATPKTKPAAKKPAKKK